MTRAGHPNLVGVDQPLSCLWNKPPAFIAAVFVAFRLFEVGTVRRMFRIALRQGQEEIGINSAKGQEVLP